MAFACLFLLVSRKMKASLTVLSCARRLRRDSAALFARRIEEDVMKCEVI